MSDNSAYEWLDQSDDDLDLALVCEYENPKDSCYHSQQSIEKAIKAILVFEDLKVPRIHDLTTLVNRVPSGWSIKNANYDLAKITTWVTARYPGVGIMITDDDTTYGINTAREIHNSVRNEIRSKSGFT